MIKTRTSIKTLFQLAKAYADAVERNDGSAEEAERRLKDYEQAVLDSDECSLHCTVGHLQEVIHGS